MWWMSDRDTVGTEVRGMRGCREHGIATKRHIPHLQKIGIVKTGEC